MDKKSITAMIKLYEKQCAEPKSHSFIDISKHFSEIDDIYQKYVLPQKTVEKQIDNFRLLYDFPLSYFIYCSFKNSDIEMLHNTLYQYACWNQIKTAHWGLLPETMFRVYIIPLLSANKIDSIDLVIPEEWGLCDKPYGVQTDLFRAIWYDDKEQKVKAKLKSEKFLAKKQTQKDINIVLYLLAILEGNTELASKYLNDVCVSDRASKDFGTTKFDRSFSIITHALYNLGQIAYNRKFKGKIEKPIQPNFFSELALYQEKLPLNQGDLVINYNEPYTLINKIILTPPVKIERIQPYIDGKPWNILSTYNPTKEFIEAHYGVDFQMAKSKEYYINCESYNEAITQSISQRL